MDDIIRILKNSSEPSIRYRLAVDVLDKPQDSLEVKNLREEVKHSPRVAKMLEGRTSDGRFPRHAYQKWKGVFYTFLVMADLGYPPGDQSLIPLREQMLEWLIDPKRLQAIQLIDDRYRECACMVGGGIHSLLRLGLADSRIEQMSEMLLKWQWPDGGWNCDKKPQASHSSFHESLIPLRGLNAYWLASGEPRVKKAIDRTSEFFLSRRLLRRLSNNELILPAFTKLAYPSFWHYDFLIALRVMHETGHLLDPRCSEALDLLESKKLENGGFPVNKKYYKVTRENDPNNSVVSWGETGKTRMNEFVTAEALSILKKAGRFKVD